MAPTTKTIPPLRAKALRGHGDGGVTPRAEPTRPRRSGPNSYYRGKDWPNKSLALTKLAKDILSAATARTGESEASVVEWLLRKHGAEVAFDRDTAGDAATT